MTSLISLYLLDHAYLIEANKQSTIDLSCISYAKAMIQHNERIRQCHFDPKDLILEKSEVINDVFVTFRDENTFIDCTYEKKKRKSTCEFIMILRVSSTWTFFKDHRCFIS